MANRADRAVVWLGGGGYVKADFSRGRGTGPCCRYGYFDHVGNEYSMTLYAPNLVDEQFKGLFWRDPDLVKVQRAFDNGAYIMLDLKEWLEESPGPVSVGPAHRALLSSDGHLFLDARVLPGSTASNWLTGEAIDVSGLTLIGSLPLIDGKAIRNDCYENAGVCSVQYDNGPVMPSPVSGLLRCVKDQRGDQAFRLEAEGLVLSLQGFGGHGFPAADCADRRISADDPLPHAVYMGLEAYRPDGTPLSLVVTRDGRLYVGEVKLRFDCPCEPRN